MNKSPIAYKRLYRKAKIENIKLKQIIDTQESRMQDLERRLAYYNNANTPPSHNALSRQARRQKKTQVQENENKDGKPRGAPKGHKGATSRPEPTKFKGIYQTDARGAVLQN